ncbi:MAG TPA: response regulator transcription factor [Bryobacteraceae bacterium]|nr:response regulator transcription factor [Bryobacteraceae bacterium]
MPGPRITVLLADDHLLVRRGFRRLLEDDPEIEVVAEAGDGPEAVEAAEQLQPDVAVLDFALPSMNGAVAARQILKKCLGTAVLMLSMHGEPSYVRTCLEAGARGYLLKNAMDLELADAVKRVAAGEQVLDPRIGSLEPPTSPERALTTRELEVLQLIVNGRSNKEIATVLGVSVNTVSVHRANIMQALGLHNTAELVVFAIREGLVSIA